MTPLATRRAAAAFLLVVPLGFSICFSLLQQLFAYPAILRQPAPDVLTQFAAGGPTLVGVWYALTLTALAFVPLTVLVQRVLSERSASPLIGLAAAFGVTAGLVQTLGFVRWPFLVPFLAQSYLTPEATEMQRVTAIGLFDAFNHYAGAGVGEHLGYLTTAVWTLLTAVVMVRTGLLSRWLGITGGVLGVGIAAGLVEPTAGSSAARSTPSATCCGQSGCWYWVSSCCGDGPPPSLRRRCWRQQAPRCSASYV